MNTSTITIDPLVVTRGRDLLERAHLLFDNADSVPDDAERFRQFYLTALRAAGAALAMYEIPTRPSRRRNSRSAWARIAATIPALADQAAHFARLSTMRMDIEAGIRRSVDPGQVTVMRETVLDFLDDAEQIVIAYEQGKLAHQLAHADRTA